MTAESIFALGSNVALASWLLLVFLPRWRVTTQVVTIAVPVLLAVAYSLMIATSWAGSAGGFTSLADVSALFDNPWLLLAGWFHYLAFDLLVGRWELVDARMRRIPHAFLVPCLIATFLFGPAGWLLYLGVRTVFRSMGRTTEPQGVTS